MKVKEPPLAENKRRSAKREKSNKSKSNKREEEARRALKRRKWQRSRGEKTKDKQWMEAARTGATERSSLTRKKKKNSSSRGERRWRRRGETCLQVRRSRTRVLFLRASGDTCGIMRAHFTYMTLTGW